MSFHEALTNANVCNFHSLLLTHNAHVFQLLFNHFYLHILHQSIFPFYVILALVTSSSFCVLYNFASSAVSPFLLFGFISLSTRQLFLSVDGPLEDEFDVALFPSQPRSTERTSSVEGMRSVRQWDLTPALHRLFRAHVTAGAERMCGGPRVQIQAPFAPEPEGHVGAHPSAHGTLSLSSGSRSCASAPGYRQRRRSHFLFTKAPVVVAVHMATVHIDPGLFLVYGYTLCQAGKGECVETHGTLGTGGV